MYKELKKVIILWLLEHENEWQRVNACIEEYKNYIYDKKGNRLIGGENVLRFIKNADKLLYGNLEEYIMVKEMD